jgi:hypothetical protein
VHGIELRLGEQPVSARQAARREAVGCRRWSQVRPRGACGPWRGDD